PCCVGKPWGEPRVSGVGSARRGILQSSAQGRKRSAPVVGRAEPAPHGYVAGDEPFGPSGSMSIAPPADLSARGRPGRRDLSVEIVELALHERPRVLDRLIVDVRADALEAEVEKLPGAI